MEQEIDQIQGEEVQQNHIRINVQHRQNNNNNANQINNLSDNDLNINED